MKITDCEGKVLMVTDLDKAIDQAKMFKSFKHEAADYKKLDIKLRRYWRDIYYKLMALKKDEKTS